MTNNDLATSLTSDDSSVIENNGDSPLGETPKQPQAFSQKNFWAVFSSTFITIFLAEMGDKTQLVTLLMSAESQAPWIVFLGAALALISTSLVGVLIGYWLSKKLSPQVLDLSVAILLLFITGWLISDVIS